MRPTAFPVACISSLWSTRRGLFSPRGLCDLVVIKMEEALKAVAETVAACSTCRLGYTGSGPIRILRSRVYAGRITRLRSSASTTKRHGSSTSFFGVPSPHHHLPWHEQRNPPNRRPTLPKTVWVADTWGSNLPPPSLDH